MKINLGIAAKINLAVGVITMIGLIALVGFFGVLSYNENLDSALENLEQQAQSAADQVGHWIAEKKAIIDIVADNPHYAEYFHSSAQSDLDYISDQLHDVVSISGDYENVFFAPFSTSRILADGNGEAIGLNISEFEFFRQVQKNESFYMDQVVYKAPTTGRNVFVMAEPVVDRENKVKGIVSTSIEWDHVARTMVADKTFGENGYVTLISKNADVIYHPNADLVGQYVLDHPGFQSFIHRAITMTSGILDYTFQGTTKFMGIADIEGTTWLAMATIEQSEILYPIVKNVILTLIIGAAVVAIMVVVMSIIISRLLAPVKTLTAAAESIASGDFDVNVAIQKKDELGRLADSFAGMVEGLKSKEFAVAKIAEGRLDQKVDVLSEKDELGKSLVTMTRSLNRMIAQIADSADQTAIGSVHISESSQTLAEGASEQAAGVEEISTSISEMSAQLEQTKQNSTKSSDLSEQALQAVEDGNARINQLVTAMNAIQQSSAETMDDVVESFTDIKKIVETIDDIAFQINLLALNANVEAARAGKYGRGFGVVAEEVRNLAVDSAQSVKETTVMVEQIIKSTTAKMKGIVQSVHDGGMLVDSTAEQLQIIQKGAESTSTLTKEIALASNQQFLAVEQIDKSLRQIELVTQSNSANAEETASASEEVAAQATLLKSYVEEFTLDADAVLKSENRVSANRQDNMSSPAARSSADTRQFQTVGASVGSSSTGNEGRMDDSDFENF